MFDSIFSDCHFPRPDLELKGSRLGYPVNYWKGLDTRVSTCHAADVCMIYINVKLHMFS